MKAYFIGLVIMAVAYYTAAIPNKRKGKTVVNTLPIPTHSTARYPAAAGHDTHAASSVPRKDGPPSRYGTA